MTVRAAVDEIMQAIEEALVRRSDLCAQTGQLRARAVENIARFTQASSNLVLEMREIAHAASDRRQIWRHGVQSSNRGPECPCTGDCGPNGEEFARIEEPSAPCALDCGADIARSPYAEIGREVQDPYGLGRQGKAMPDQGGIWGWLERGSQLFARRETAEAGEPSADLVEFQKFNRFLIHDLDRTEQPAGLAARRWGYDEDAARIAGSLRYSANLAF